MSVVRPVHRGLEMLLHLAAGARCAAPGLPGRVLRTGGRSVRVGPWGLLAASALCLSACAVGPPDGAVGRAPAPDPAADGGTPLARLPASAGRVVAVRRVAYANGFRQEIVLGGPRAMAGENRITVQALTTTRTGGRGLAGEELKLGPPGDAEVAAEMERALPGVPMRIEATPERDADGPLGIATGAAGHLACVYAWQYLGPARPASLFEGFSDTGALPVTVRVRLCGERPVPALLADLRDLRTSRPAPGADVPGPGLAGDALEAAVGNSGSVPGGAMPAGGEVPQAGRRALRRGPHVGERHRGSAERRRPLAGATGLRSPVGAEAGRALPSVPRLPMPSEVPGASPATQRAPEPVPARTAAQADDALPLPR